MLRKVFVTLVLATTFIGAGWSVLHWLKAHRPAPERRDLRAQAPLVGTLRLVREDARDVLYGYGTARADRQATLRAEVSAPIVELVGGLAEGIAVEEGQLLLRLDDRQYQQELDEARSLLQAAEADLAQISVRRSNYSSLLEIATSDLQLNRDELTRVQGLFEKGNAPKTEYDDARLAYQSSLRAKQLLDNEMALLEPQRLRALAEMSAAQARADRAQLNIDRCQITAPFPGIIESVAVEIGDKVQIGSELLRLVDLTRIEVPLQLPVSTRSRARAGAAVTMYVESIPDLHWTGQVARIAPVADERSRSFELYVEVDNSTQPTPLLPGFFVKAEVDGPILAGALLVPRQAVIDGQVFLANDGHAHARRVDVARYLGERALVSGDVQPGDEVITTNLDVLFDGAAVRCAGETVATPAGAETQGTQDTNGAAAVASSGGEGAAS